VRDGQGFAYGAEPRIQKLAGARPSNAPRSSAALEPSYEVLDFAALEAKFHDV